MEIKKGVDYAMVARLVPRKEVEKTPAAKDSIKVEWQKLRDRTCWDISKAREWKDVVSDAAGASVHRGSLLELCYEKGS